MQVNGPDRPWQPASGIAAWRPTARASGRLGLRRVAAAMPPLAGDAASRWATWAHRLANRHGATHQRWQRLAMILGRPRLASRTTIRPMHWTVATTIQVFPPGATRTIATRVGARPTSLASPRRSRGIVHTVAPAPRHVLARTMRPEPATAAHALVTDVSTRRVARTDLWRRFSRTVNREQQLVERLLARSERREQPESPSRPALTPPPSSNRPGMESLQTPAAIVVRGRSNVGSPHAEPTPLRAFAPSSMEGEAPARPAQPAIDVESLADQVIRTIDQRVIAARERLGMSWQ